MKILKKNNKGFTLVEILTAVAILGILSAIAIAGVQTVMNSSKTKYYKSLKEMIISAAKEYYSDHKSELPVDIDDSSDPLYLSTLVNDDYLDPVKDVNGKACADTSTITVYKTGAKEYEYLLSLSCPKDPNMPKDINDAPTSQKGTIRVVCKPSTSKKKASAYLQLDNRSDYRYEVLKMNKEGKWEEVANKKGNIKDGKNIVNIPLNYGSGTYKVRAETGSGANKSEDSCEDLKIESPEPDCDGIEYEINHVAKEWFKGTLETTITTDEEKMERYNIDSIKIDYIDTKTKKTIESTNKKAVGKDILNNGLKLTYTKDNAVTKGELSVTIYNDADDSKKCKLGEYWMDNKPPTCVVGSDKRVNAPQDKTTWTNRDDAKVTIDCDDEDNNGEDGSGCRQKTYEDTTEDKFANFNKNGKDDEIYIEDNVGNTPDDDGSCKNIAKLIDRTPPRCSEVSKYAEHDWGKDYKAWSRCADDVNKNVTPSECTTDTVYQEEGAPDGETKTFTIKDNAGNTTPCLADKHRDNVPPICTGSTFSTWSNTSAKRAFVDCKDSQGAGKSGCKEDKVWEKDISDGVSLTLTCEDYAGNTSSSVAEKKRDRVKPYCTGFDSKYNTSTAMCNDTYYYMDTKDPENLVYARRDSDPISYQASCQQNITVGCGDDLSGCEKSTITQSSNTVRANVSYDSYSSNACISAGRSDCFSRVWHSSYTTPFTETFPYDVKCRVSQASCDSVNKITSVEIKDNAGNKETCTNNSKAPSDPNINTPAKPTAPPMAPACGSRTTNNSLDWTNVTTTLTFNVNSDNGDFSIRNWPGSHPMYQKSGNSFTVTYENSGEYNEASYEVCNGDACRPCQLPKVRIDKDPPHGQYQFEDRNDNIYGIPRCVDGDTTYTGGILKFNVNYHDIYLYDELSGLKTLRFMFAPEFKFNGLGYSASYGVANPQPGTASDIRDFITGKGTTQGPICPGISCDQLGRSCTIPSITFRDGAQSPGIDIRDGYSDLTNVPVCYNFCISLMVYDIAGNDSTGTIGNNCVELH